MHEDLERLERLAITDLEARKEWARALKRSGDPRAPFVELSIKPGSYQWVQLCKLRDVLSKEDQIATSAWLDPLLSHWRELNLSGIDMSDVSALTVLTNLTQLNIHGTKVSDISALAKLANLTRLNLKETQVSDVSALAKLTNLTSLNLSHTQVSDVSALAKLTNLTYLNLRRTQVSDVSALKTLTNSQTSAIRSISQRHAGERCDTALWQNSQTCCKGCSWAPKRVASGALEVKFASLVVLN